MNSNQPLRGGLVVSLLVTSLLITAGLALKPLQIGTAKESVKTEQPKVSTVSKSSEGSHADLAKSIDQAIDDSELKSGRWGISVVSMDGATVYQRDGDKLFTPASNMKIYTTAVALDLLGPDYRWKTSVYAESQPDAAGTIKGDLILYGRGAPDLVSASSTPDRPSLMKLANDLYERGVRSINGDVIGDESYFRGEPVGDGWQWNDIQWYFGAEASALSINDNEVEVNLVPSEKGGDPPVVRTSDTTGLVTFQNRMVSVDKSGRPTIGVHRDLSGNEIQVWGEFPRGTRGFGARLSVHNPALWATKLFVNTLQARGIKITGQPRTRDSRMAQGGRFDPSKAIELTNVSSATLAEIARKTNKLSMNLYAELILRTMGRERGETGTQAQPPGRERGDDEAGLSLIREWLSRAGIATEALALHDGSGLSRLDLVTPDSAARLLVSMSQRPAGAVFRDSLPVAGKDGTLGGRLKPVAGKVFAKTGSLVYDTSLSGYLTTSQDQTFAFSIMCNDQTGRADSGRVIDEIVALLVQFSGYSQGTGRKSQ